MRCTKRVVQLPKPICCDHALPRFLRERVSTWSRFSAETCASVYGRDWSKKKLPAHLRHRSGKGRKPTCSWAIPAPPQRSPPEKNYIGQSCLSFVLSSACLRLPNQRQKRS